MYGLAVNTANQQKEKRPYHSTCEKNQKSEKIEPQKSVRVLLLNCVVVPKQSHKNKKSKQFI